MIMQATRISLAALAMGWMSGCQSAGKVTNTAAKPKITQGSSVLAGTAAKNSTPKPLPPGETVSLAIQVGQRLENDGHLREAAVQYDRALAIEPNRAKLVHHLGVVYDRLGEYNAAREVYAKAKALKPNNVDIDIDIAFSYYLSGEYDESIRLGQAVAASHPDKVRAWNNLGLAMAQKGRVDDAREAFSRGSSPSQAECNLAFVFLTKGDFEGAKQSYQKALIIEPDMAAARAGLEKVKNARGNEVMSAQAGS